MTDSPLLISRVAVIGGGAAGLMAAIAAATAWREAGSPAGGGKSPRPVLLLEKQDRVGRKLLATGNGQCNLSNQAADISHYHGREPRFAAGALHRLPVMETVSLFRQFGLPCRVEANGRIYPYSYQGSAVLDLLRLTAARLGVQTLTSCAVTGISPRPSPLAGFALQTADGRQIRSECVIVATGGLAAPSLGSDGSGYGLLERLGHRLTDVFPAIVQIRTETDLVRGLAGIKIDGTAAVQSDDRLLQAAGGEILFTEYGLSGPPILELSRLVGETLRRKPDQPVWVVLDLLPDMPAPELLQWLEYRRQTDPTVELAEYLTGLVNKKVGQAVLKRCLERPLSQPAGSLTEPDRRRLAEWLKALPIRATGTRDWNQAQVTAGGLDVRDFRPDTLESRLQPGLYAAGEILDIDGDCGGYNLQWAWSSGHLAGRRAMAACLADRTVTLQ